MCHKASSVMITVREAVYQRNRGYIDIQKKFYHINYRNSQPSNPEGSAENSPAGIFCIYGAAT